MCPHNVEYENIFVLLFRLKLNVRLLVEISREEATQNIIKIYFKYYQGTLNMAGLKDQSKLTLLESGANPIKLFTP